MILLHFRGNDFKNELYKVGTNENSGRGKEHQNEKTAKKLGKIEVWITFFFRRFLGAQKKSPKESVFF